MKPLKRNWTGSKQHYHSIFTNYNMKSTYLTALRFFCSEQNVLDKHNRNWRYAYFRILMDCTAVSDFGCKEGSMEYQHPPSMMPGYEHIAPAWAVTKLQQDALHSQLAPAKDLPLGPDSVNVFGAGIQYDMSDADGSIQPVPRAGRRGLLNVGECVVR